MDIGVWISLAFYFVLMLGIGFYAMRKSTSSSEEYLLAGRRLNPAVAALSAGASDMSGWLLLGLPCAIFIVGLHDALIVVGQWSCSMCNLLVICALQWRTTHRLFITH